VEQVLGSGGECAAGEFADTPDTVESQQTGDDQRDIDRQHAVLDTSEDDPA
jgi:hypothetical protein